MARYPKVAPKWAATPYGGNEDAWEEAKRQCRAILCAWARQGRFGTYSELMQDVSAIGWPEGAFTHEGHQMGYLLGQVSLEELDRVEDRPVLSSLVVGKDEGMPSRGYWTFLRDDLGMAVPIGDLDRLELWQAEFKAARDYYAQR